MTAIFQPLHLDRLLRMDSDPRIGPMHISLYLAIVRLSYEKNHINPISFFSRDLMSRAKICGTATYHRCIRDLHELGYIAYEPSFNHLRGSRIRF